MHNGMLVDSACTFTMCVCGDEYYYIMLTTL